MTNFLATLSMVALLGGTSLADTASCDLSVRVVLNGEPVPVAVIKPEHVSQILRSTDEPSGQQLWEVRLTKVGAEINREFTRDNLGKQIAVFCGEREVARPKIVGPSSDSFAFTLPDES